MHLFDSFRRPRGLTLALLLVLLALTLSGCALIAGPEEGSGAAAGTPDTGAIADDENGTLTISAVTEPAGQAGSFTFTGVPSGTVSIGDTLVISDLAPGAYTTTQVDPAPDFDLTAVDCDDGDSVTTSSGDAQTRTAVLNLDPGETIRCTFTNTRRGTVVVATQVDPEGSVGRFLFTGVPSGTVPANGTLVVANLPPGTYTTTEADPAPEFDLAAVECDDGGSPTASSGDPSTRTAIINVDPGELVTCTFANNRRGTVVVASQVSPESAEGSFLFTGVPSGTIPANGTLVVANLSSGTYATTQADPEPDFELTDVSCDDGGSAATSSGDPSTRTAIFNVDPGELVTCTFENSLTKVEEPAEMAGGAASEGGTGSEAEAPSGTNPFDDPDPAMERFPLPEDLPPDAGTYPAPKAGPWSVVNHAGRMTCDTVSLNIPASPPESGILEVLDSGRTLIGSGLQEDEASITLMAQPEWTGRYAGAFEGTEQGVPVTINYFWQVVTDEYIVGFLTASVTSQGVNCEVYRSYEMTYTG